MDRRGRKLIRGMPYEWKSGFPETPCGRGSKFENTKEIRRIVPNVCEDYRIKTIADVGCGDKNWINACLPNDVAYVGFDIMPRDSRTMLLDCTREVIPVRADLILCIYVLNHVPTDAAERAIRLFRESGSKYVLMSYSDADEYATEGELVESWHHKTRQETGVTWRYGLWRL